MQLFENSTEKILKENNAPGAMVAISKNGKVVYQRAFGYKNIETKESPSEHTVYGLASLTKSFTCLAILQLEEEGLLSVNDPVINYLPDFKLHNDSTTHRMTIHHFMTHTSGIPPMSTIDYAMVLPDNKNWGVVHEGLTSPTPKVDTYEDLMDDISKQEVNMIGYPGERYSYSNEAYSLLGAIIEKVSGISYKDYIVENITKKIGMKNTYFLKTEYPEDTDFSVCYERNEKIENSELYVEDDWWDAPSMRATGFLKSTSHDMLLYGQMYIDFGKVNDEQIFSEQIIQKMIAPHVKMDIERNYGYGLSRIEDYFGDVLIDHGGSLPAISSKFTIIPTQKITAIVLVNLMSVPAYKIMTEMLNAYFGRTLDESPFDYSEIHLSEKKTNERVGLYTSPEGMRVELLEANKSLRFYYKDEEYPIKVVSENAFIAKFDDSNEPVEWIQDSNGKIIGLTIFHRILNKQKGKEKVNG